MDTVVNITSSTVDLCSLISDELNTENLPDFSLGTQPLVPVDLAPDIITLEDLSTDHINDINEIHNKEDDEVGKMTERLTSLNVLEHIPRLPSVPNRKIAKEKMDGNDCPETLEDRPARSDKGRRASVASIGNRRGRVTGFLARRDSTSSLGSRRDSTSSRGSRRDSTSSRGSRRDSTSSLGSRRDSTSSQGSRRDSTSSLGSRRSSSDIEGSESLLKLNAQRRRNSSLSIDGDQEILTQFRIAQRKERRSSAATLDMFTTLWKVRTAAINGLKSRRSKSVGRAESQDNEHIDTEYRESRLAERGRRMSLLGYDRRPSMSQSVSSNSRSPSPSSRGSGKNQSAENSPRSAEGTSYPFAMFRNTQNRRGSLRPISPVQEDSSNEESIHAVKNSNIHRLGLIEEQGTEIPAHGRRRHSIHDLASVVAASKRFSQMAKQKIVQVSCEHDYVFKRPYS